MRIYSLAQGPLYSMLYGDLEVAGKPKAEGICTCIAEGLHFAVQ